MHSSTDPVLVQEGSPSARAGITLGIGLGGFVDGIVLHQIAGWHNMGSAVLPPTTMEGMRQNMIWDGQFHAAVWVVTLLGVMWMWRDSRAGRPLPAGRVFAGQLILGWGLFNIVEGLIDHHLLELHHVRDLPWHVPSYDWAFLLVGGVGLVVLGWVMVRGQGKARA
jgi:uncharacterized membrane protein